MTLDDLKDYFKSKLQFEKQTGLKRQNWHAWIKKGFIPLVSQQRIESLTNGDLKANFEHAKLKTITPKKPRKQFVPDKKID
jgi:hypothetical protein